MKEAKGVKNEVHLEKKYYEGGAHFKFSHLVKKLKELRKLQKAVEILKEKEKENKSIYRNSDLSTLKIEPFPVLLNSNRKILITSLPVTLDIEEKKRNLYEEGTDLKIKENKPLLDFYERNIDVKKRNKCKYHSSKIVRNIFLDSDISERKRHERCLYLPQIESPFSSQELRKNFEKSAEKPKKTNYFLSGSKISILSDNTKNINNLVCPLILKNKNYFESSSEKALISFQNNNFSNYISIEDKLKSNNSILKVNFPIRDNSPNLLNRNCAKEEDNPNLFLKISKKNEGKPSKMPEKIKSFESVDKERKLFTINKENKSKKNNFLYLKKTIKEEDEGGKSKIENDIEIERDKILSIKDISKLKKELRENYKHNSRKKIKILI